MKNFILIWIVFIITINSYSADEPIVKIYTNDGDSVKVININDIDKINIIKKNNNYEMIVFYGNNLSDKYPIPNIDTIKFLYQGEKLILNLKNVGAKWYDTNDIDSIIFTYNTCTEIQIGWQKWMCKNLNVSHYRNGDTIRFAESVEDWVDAGNKKEGAWCYYANYDLLGESYGKLYNYYAVIDPRNLAPSGWHIATTQEWWSLVNYLGGDSLAGGKLKEVGISHWGYPNRGATNSSGFTALPGGYRSYIGNYSMLYEEGLWWGAPTGYDKNRIYYVHFNNVKVGYSNAYEAAGFSVRCIKDK